MPKGKLTPGEIDRLLQNPFVEKVVDTKIIYTGEFRERFIKEYREGKDAGSIFADAGFDTDVLGRNRIREARNNWRRRYRLDEDCAGKRGSVYREMSVEELKAAIDLILADSGIPAQIR